MLTTIFCTSLGLDTKDLLQAGPPTLAAASASRQISRPVIVYLAELIYQAGKAS